MDTELGVIEHYTPPTAVKNTTDWKCMWERRGERLLARTLELEEMTRQRDMLATRCAEQAKQIAAMASVSIEKIISDIRQRADDDGCFHFDSLREILKANGCV